MKKQIKQFLSVLVLAATVSFMAGPALAEIVTYNFTGTITCVSDPPPYGLSLSGGDPVTGSISYDPSLPPAYDTGTVAGYIQEPPNGMSVVIGDTTVQSAGNASLQVLNNGWGVDNFNGYFTPISVNGQVQFSHAMSFYLSDMTQTVFSSTALPDSLDVDSFDGRSGAIFAGPGITVSFSIDTIEKEAIPVIIDIKPGSCPNSLNLRSRGVLPVSILGTEDFDVTTIDPSTIELTLEGIEGGVSPISWSYEDVATPYEGELCDCHDLDGDGYLDLKLVFDTQEVIETLMLTEALGETIPLTITGNIEEEYDGTPIMGQDCVRVLEQEVD